MAFTVETSTGSTLTLTNGDQITVNGQNLYINDIGPYAQGSRRRHRIIAPRNVSVATFAQLNNTTLAPEYNTPATVRAQIKADSYQPDQAWDPTDGPDQPRTVKTLYLQEASLTAGYPLIKVKLVDAPRGQMFVGYYTVKFVPYTSSGGNQNLGIPPTTSAGTPRTLHPTYVSLTDQVVVGQMAVHLGQARIQFPRNEATYAELTGHMAIEITPRGVSPMLYRLRNAGDLKQPQTYDWDLELERIRP